jgi:hypothetical protein
VLTSLVADFVTVWLTEGIDWDGDLVSGMMRTMVAAQATYLAFWKNAGAKAIEENTSGGP